MWKFLSGNLKCLNNKRLACWSVRSTLDATFLVLLILYTLVIYFTLITVLAFMWQLTVYVLSASGEELWCVNKPGPSPNKPLLDAWHCLAGHHNPCVRAQVVYYQIQESHLQHRNKHICWECIIPFVIYVFVINVLENTTNSVWYTRSDVKEAWWITIQSMLIQNACTSDM